MAHIARDAGVPEGGAGSAAMATDDNAGRLHRVRRTVCEMLRGRGYLLQDVELKRTRDEFAEVFGEEPRREDLMILAPKLNDPTEQIFVFFIEGDTGEKGNPKVGVKAVKAALSNMSEQGIKRAILIVETPLTPFARNAVAEAPSHGYKLETFKEVELLVNITLHDLVPKHQLLSREEKAALLSRYKVKESQLPRIQMNDPVARYMGLEKGQVIRIVRPSETAGRYVTYRYCI